MFDTQRVISLAQNDLKQGNYKEAASGFKSVLRKFRDHPDLLSAVGECRIGLNDFEDAIGYFQSALNKSPDHFYSLMRGAYCLSRLGRNDEAATLLKRAHAVASGDIDVMNNLGSCLKADGRADEALAWFRRAAALDPKNVNVSLNMASLLGQMKRDDEARTLFERMLEADPDSSDVHYLYAQFLRTRDYIEARMHFEAIDVTDNIDGLAALVEIDSLICRWDVLEENIARLRRMLEAGRFTEPQNVVFTFDDQSLALTNARRFCTAHFPSPAMAMKTKIRMSEPVRVGYLSADFREHPMGYLFAGIPEHHDRAKVAPVALLTRNDACAVRDRIMRGCAEAIDISGQREMETARSIAEAGVDILVDLGGHMGGARPDVLRHRPARVIVNWAGFANTAGSSFHDYIIVDPFVAPKGSDHLFSEKLVRLPEVYLCHDDRRASPFGILDRQSQDLPDDAVVFGVFNNLRKLRPAVFAAWLDLLKLTPGAVLWIMAPDDASRAALRAHAAAGGVDAGRFVFADYVGQEEHLARLPLADIILDTVPCGAHTSATDCLWMGVPIVTIEGESMPARVCASLLRNVGLPEMIASDLESYRAIALGAAHDRDRLAAMRARLRAARGRAPLFDTARFVRHLESAFLEMARLARHGRKPQAIDVAPLNKATS